MHKNEKGEAYQHVVVHLASEVVRVVDDDKEALTGLGRLLDPRERREVEVALHDIEHAVLVHLLLVPSARRI